MKPKFCSNILLSLVCIFQITFGYSQVTTKTYAQGIKDSKILSRLKNVKDFIIDLPTNFSKLKENAMHLDSNSKHDYIFKFATPGTINYDVMKNAQILADSDTVTYLIRLKAKDALNLSLHFSSFFLSKHSTMFIYNSRELTGPITEKENNTDNFWATRVYNGNSIVVEVNVPKSEIGITHLVVSKVFLGYRQTGYNYYFGTPGASAPCNANVVCPQTYGSGTLKYAVALINPDGTDFVTGTLLMNTCNTNIPYLLTANHVYTSAPNVSRWVFQFQYWSTNCNTNTGWIESVQYNGATLKANWGATDFALLQLNQVPPSNSGIAYAGWSRNTPPPQGAVPVSTFSLHHPRGDLMKYCSDNSYPTTSSIGATNSHWVANFDYGTVEPGSSGSALFDANGRVIGQLQGSQIGTSDFCAIRRGEYGRFDMSWTGGGTSATRLSDWLDPTNSGATTTNTTNIANLSIGIMNLSISGAGLFCTGSSTYTLNGAPAGSAITWTTSDPNVGSIPPPPYGATVSVTRVNAGNLTLTASIPGCPRNFTATKSIHIGGYSSPDYPISGSSSGYCGNTVYFSTKQLTGGTYTWTYPSGWSANGSSTYSLALQVPLRTSGNYQVSVRVANACDAGGSPTFAYFYVSCSTLAPAYTVSPNPATNEVTVTGSKTSTKSAIAPSIREVNIYDQLGILRKNQKFSKVPKASVNLSGLSTGVYVIEIVDGTNKVRQNFTIIK
jgi:hypothetical protein